MFSGYEHKFELEKAHTVLGILGNIASIAFFLSSLPAIISKFKKVKATDQYTLPTTFYICTLFNCMLWVLYGLPLVDPHSFLVIITNSFGSVFAFFYIIACFTLLNNTHIKQKILLGCKVGAVFTSYTALVLVVIFLLHSQHLRIAVVGTICAVVSSCMHISLLCQTGLFFETKDVKYLQPISSIAGFCKGAIWTAYGAVFFHLYIVVPNAVGVAVGVIQVVIFLIGGRKAHKSAKIIDADAPIAFVTVSIQGEKTKENLV